MKWFKNLLDNADENKRRMDESMASLEAMEEEVKKEPKPKPEPEIIDVEVDGKYSYKVEHFKNEFDEESYHIKFDYKVVAKFLEHEAEIESSVYEYPTYKIGRFGMRVMQEEEMYERLLELLTEKRKQLMALITSDIACKIHDYIRDKNLEKIKEEIKVGQEVELNFTFRMEKPKNA